MINIKLGKSEFDFLLTCDMDERLIDSLKRSFKKQFEDIYLQIKKGEVEEILDFLGVEFANKGLQHGEPNSLGMMIENIIDKLSKEVYE